MVQCPKCNGSIEADFGVVNCPTCQVLVSVGFDGSVSLAEEDIALETSQDVSSFIESSSDPLPSLDPVESFESFHQEVKQEQVQEFVSTAEDVNPEVTAMVEEFVSMPNPFEEEVAERTKVLASPSLKDVEAFGNSELSSTAQGGLVYDLQIEGIDSKDIKEEIGAVLADPKMKFNVDLMMRSIKDGKLTIRRINSAKASIIVNQLKHLPIQIHWMQNEIIRL